MPTITRRRLFGLIPLPFLAPSTPSTGQPIPIETWAVRRCGVTAIMRRWREGDVARCKLCSDCCAEGDTCLIATSRYVGKGEASLFECEGPMTDGRLGAR